MYNSLIQVAQLNDILQNPNTLIVDCRFSLADTEWGRNAYKEAHIPGAIYAHLDEDLSGDIIPEKTSRHPLPSKETLELLLSKWGVRPNIQVIAYDDKGGAIASRLWWMMKWTGHTKAAVLNGGISAWVAAKLPTSHHVSTKTPSTFKANWNDALFVTTSLVEKIKDHPEYHLIDSRNAERYRGEHEPIDPIAGHIPHAINYPFIENFNEDKTMKSPEELKERFAELQDKTPIFYCGSGVTACHNILAWTYAGLGDVKLYPPSWSGWIFKDT